MDAEIDRLRALNAELIEALKEVSNAYGCFAGCTASLPDVRNPGVHASRKHHPSCQRARDALARAARLAPDPELTP